MSGQYVTRHGIYRVNQVDKKYQAQRPVEPPVNITDLPLNIETLADSMKRAGYTTGYCGKWHLGYGGQYLPAARGFEQVMLTRSPSGDERYFFPKFSTVPKADIEKGTYMTDFVTDWSIDFLERNGEKPFFLYIPYFSVHGPHEAKAETIAKYRKKAPQKSKLEQIYAAMHEDFDAAVGRLMSKLDQLKLKENTVVIFTSDNGHLPQFAEELRGGKSYLYEGGVRVPLMISHPGQIPSGDCAQAVHHVDLYPTLLKMAGASLPSQALDGIELNELLLSGGESKLTERPLFWHYPTYMKFDKKQKKYKVTPCSVILKGNFKLIDHFVEKRHELFDLDNDPQEKINISEKMPEKTRELKSQLLKWRRKTNAMMPEGYQ